MYKAIINGKTLKAKTLTALKRLASIEANNNFRVYDEFYLIDPENKMPPLVYIRRNKKAPNNTIERGQWK